MGSYGKATGSYRKDTGSYSGKLRGVAEKLQGVKLEGVMEGNGVIICFNRSK